MEATEGGTGKRTGGDSDTESYGSTDSETESGDPFLKILKERIRSARCSPETLSMMKNEDRNRDFLNIVMDRRRGNPERLLCCSNDVVLTFETRTGKKDFYFIERAHGVIGQGDALFKKCSGWPEINRGGTYKYYIEEML